MTRAILICLTLLGLTACSPRGEIAVLPGQDSGTVQTVYVATNRNPATGADPNTVQQNFGAARHPQLRFARIDVSVPPNHALGQIEWPGQAKPDPTRHFVTTDGAIYDGQAAFRRALRRAPGAQAREIVLFVHGYNVNNAEALYRLAQVAHDYQAPVPVLAYSWASAGSPQGYAYDRDSVIFSRDGLEDLLTGLAADDWQITVIAHSMGSQLVMETLRQISIAGRHSVLDNIEAVALISPDIDADVFVQQARRIQPFPQPFAMLVSARDRALGLSAWLTGTPARLGAIRSTDRLGGLPVEIIDLSAVEGGDTAGHATAFTAPAAIRMLRRLAR
jgi:esterase/lipase superfamily enzyme